MAARSLVLVWLCVVFLALLMPSDGAAGTPDGSEEWGYVQVRPKAHMFWWLYRSPQRVENGSTPWPTVLWLQGGPGASGVGYGNFMEIGPLDSDLKPRPTTWLAKADLLFVDNPVGTGFSFVEGGDPNLMVRTDAEAADDLTTLLCSLYRDNNNARLRGSPLYIVAESYGGKFAVTTALKALKAIQEDRLHANIAGVALGDSWISPIDFVVSLSLPLLLLLLLLASYCSCIVVPLDLDSSMTVEWLATVQDFYNFLKDRSPLTAAAKRGRSMVASSFSFRTKNGYSGYLSSMATPGPQGGFSGLMNTVIKNKLGIIPQNVSWGDQSGDVFDVMQGDFMKPRIHEVDQLLELGVNVTIYNGQLDLICATKGTMDWVQKLKWDGLQNFTNSPRTPIYCSKEGQTGTQAFVKSYKNLKFYWILGAGHMVSFILSCCKLNCCELYVC
ncbi:hypothetical protein PR202_ga21814 [Eleusine coracana subsp. coracana]|uniref:Carboxypeptidase n=1 Tax=Eleusine coracana subsp. coracana TaxID=191504 RepID=A0AAV5D1Y6_ELECO|nr:hypothetical protein PR202_ga21814 [Eleusine coracana subsp. coracana]